MTAELTDTSEDNINVCFWKLMEGLESTLEFKEIFNVQ